MSDIKSLLADHKATLGHMGVTLFGAIISYIQELELYVRFLGTLVAIIAGMLTIYRLWLEIKVVKRKVDNGLQSDNRDGKMDSR